LDFHKIKAKGRRQKAKGKKSKTEGGCRMIERIDLFMPPRSQYQVLHHFTKSLATALSRAGVKCRILEAQREQPQAFIDTILEDLPECTLSFNGLLPDADGRFFCELINVPHLGCTVDGAQGFVTLTQSPLSIITAADRFACDFYRGLNFNNVFFMPHAVEKDIIQPFSAEERNYDVLMLATFIDFAEIANTWKQQYGEPFQKTLEEAAEAVLSANGMSYVQALTKALDRYVRTPNAIDIRKIDILFLLDQFEDFILGKHRFELIKAIKDAKVHIFGTGSNRWKQFLGKSSNAITHEPVSYEQALNLMRHSKIILNSCPSIAAGGHERIFAGFACGAAVLSDENIYLRENFKHGEDILFYHHGKKDEVNNLINEYLEDSSKRQALIAKGQEVVKNGHTWDHRAATILKELPPILESIS
jgi:spore maturation protein CgeB